MTTGLRTRLQHDMRALCGSRRTTAFGLAGVALLALSLLVAPRPAAAATKIEGYYEAELVMERSDENWKFGQPGENGMPQHYAELKFLTWPSDNLEAFVKLRVQSSHDDDRLERIDYYAPPWFLTEGHLKLRSKQYEVYLFSRQNRFWINDEPLLSLIEDYKFRNDGWRGIPNAQGVRCDFWDLKLLGVKNLGGTIILSDNGGVTDWGVGDQIRDGDDALVVRLRHRALGDRIESGMTILRKDWTFTSNPDLQGVRDLHHLMHNSVYAADVAFSPKDLSERGLFFGPINLEQSRWTLELAMSEEPFREKFYGDSNRHNKAFAAEVRDIHLSDVILHAWHFDFGEDFRDYLSGRFDNDRQEYNRVQNHAEVIWLVPKKAITAKVTYDHYRKRFADLPGGGRRPATEWYGELYMEFKNGFKGRIAYKQWRGYDSAAEVSDFFTYPMWFGEVSVENFLAKIRLQGRVRDAGTFRQISAVGFDMNVNLTEKLKGYLRMMNVNEPIESRYTMFAQLKYEVGWGAEFYLEYGDAGQSDNIVYTDWFLDETNNDFLRDRIKLFVKTWF